MPERTIRLAGSMPATLACVVAMLAFACAHAEAPAPTSPPPAPAPGPPPAPAVRHPTPRPAPPAAASDDFSWPVRGRVLSKFGACRGRTKHAGLDIRAPLGTPVVAAAAGRVSFSGWMRGYGNVIFVEHGPDLETRYAHLRRRVVRKGAWVDRGRVIGQVGATGNATTPHLHFEVRERRIATNPLTLLSLEDGGGLTVPASLP